MNPIYPPQAYPAGRPNGAPAGMSPSVYGAQSNPAIPAQPPPLGFNPALYQHQTQTPAYSSTSPYANHVSVAPSLAQYRYQQQPPPIYSSAPAYITQAPGVSAMSYNTPGAYTYSPGQPTYIQQPAQPVSNLTVVQPARNVYVPNATPSQSYDAGTLAGLGFVAGAALGSGHHHYHPGYGHHSFGPHHSHHGFNHHHGFGHH